MPEYTSPEKPQVNEQVWEIRRVGDKWKIFCKPCNDRSCKPEGRNPYLAQKHEGSTKHIQNSNPSRSKSSQSQSNSSQPHTRQPAVPITTTFDLAATRLIRSFLPVHERGEDLPEITALEDISNWASNVPSTSGYMPDWTALDVMDGEFELPADELGAISEILARVNDIWDNGPDMVVSDDEEMEIPLEDEERLEGDRDEVTPESDHIYLGAAPKRRRAEEVDEMHQWFPWDSRLTCSLDIMMHIPRSLFSTRQLDLYLWLLRVNGVSDVPSVKTMKQLNENLQKLFGIQTYKYKGAFGHIYYVNSFADIVAQEMANPRVRPNLSFYPEDSGGNLGEARQASRWLKEMDDDELTPMVRLGKGRAARDFYIFEPALLSVHGGSMWMPHRWYTKTKAGGQTVLVGRCWQMKEMPARQGGGEASWRVLTNDEGEFEQDEFLIPFPDLRGHEHSFGFSAPVTNVTEVVAPCGDIIPWDLTDPMQGNCWRALGKGHRVNRSQASKEFNIHFLCTSNTAPPLEMLDGVVDQISDGQTHGIWAWDGEFHEPVLLIPAVLALLGDNPMQSEFACHIGLRGRMFCRSCKVMGKDFKDEHGDAESDGGHGSDDNEDDDHDSVASNGSTQGVGGRKKRKKFVEGLLAMQRRPGAPRTKAETVEQLDEHFRMGFTPGAASKMKAERTRTGLKDTYQMFFVDRLLNSYKGRRTVATKTAALNQARSALPEQTTSAVWRIRGLNPHSDTPVEILHVVLLGFVKYLWRDVIQNQLKKKVDKMAELSARLSSVNVEGLGLPSFLAGDTLTKYYGSLTGGDFRKIAQVAPFVLHGLVSDDCYETWVVLSKLIPLIWQPEIADLSRYLETLESEIQNFLIHAAKWSIRWFNKPKFHILVHLPDHIRRFGPAILFATESFESYNAVIRCKSTHSNRQSPSRDIAYGFAQGNRIRHLSSGGQFLLRGTVGWTEEEAQAKKDFDNAELPQARRITDVQLYFRKGNIHRDHWVTVGPRLLELIDQSAQVVGRYLGLSTEGIGEGPSGKCEFEKNSRYTTFAQTRTSKLNCQIPQLLQPDRHRDIIEDLRVAEKITLDNGDKVGVGTHVIVRLSSDPDCSPPSSTPDSTCTASNVLLVASVAEILHHRDGWSVVLVRLLRTSPESSVHGMPRLRPRVPDSYVVLPREDILCTANVQHDCIRQKCKVHLTQVVRQERHDTGLRRGQIVHNGDPHDIVLNTAKMRDAKFIQKFRVSHKILPVEDTIKESTEREVASLRRTKEAADLVLGHSPLQPLSQATRSPDPATSSPALPLTRGPPHPLSSRPPSRATSTFSPAPQTVQYIPPVVSRPRPRPVYLQHPIHPSSSMGVPGPRSSAQPLHPHQVTLPIPVHAYTNSTFAGSRAILQQPPSPHYQHSPQYLYPPTTPSPHIQWSQRPSSSRDSSHQPARHSHLRHQTG
ncbi:hypothetical protein PQX77_008081 [Marasmius sp. AFHP31]|nr:hypothetical protein PQX77_008081 [Marasmius sp. AFHP31]